MTTNDIRPTYLDSLDEVNQLRAERSDLIDDVVKLRAELEKVRAQLADTQHRAHTDATNLQQILRDKTALANENAELRRVAMVYRKAMVGQHNWAGHLINVDCERCDKAADEMDSSFACVEYQNWQREYESALSTGLPKTAEVAK